MKSLKEFLQRINGFSTPIIGLSWNPGIDEEKAIYALLQKLANRRLLDNKHGLINKIGAIKSIEIMRNDITQTLIDISVESIIRQNIENIRGLLKAFQTYIEHQVEVDEHGNIRMTQVFVDALDEVRKMINQNALSFIDDEGIKHLPTDYNGKIDVINIG